MPEFVTEINGSPACDGTWVVLPLVIGDFLSIHGLVTMTIQQMHVL